MIMFFLMMLVVVVAVFALSMYPMNAFADVTDYCVCDGDSPYTFCDGYWVFLPTYGHVTLDKFISIHRPGDRVAAQIP
ncbi:hypothetical protein SAMN05444955_11770 [Lihuaxuella thermophila]|uniref:Uncharacterized protein n=1 Tax=Lihuaxuella thermophila TaxID=1173111 RepID=A0A1H8IHT7_9BACL|nr:hypothetical protein SAMN05444955_11770 [Lihuaxuella thermophila]